MEWVCNSGNTLNQQFELWSANEKLVGITYNQQKRVARMVSSLSRRLFQFEKKGAFFPKAIVRNEYGIPLAKIEPLQPGGKKGKAELDGVTYYYELDENNGQLLHLYEDAQKKNALTCRFTAVMSGIGKTRSLLDGCFPSLLWALCWYKLQLTQS